MEENENKTLSAEQEAQPKTDNFNDPAFDAAIGKTLSEALEAHDAVPDDCGGTRYLMVTITLAEYRQLCRDAGNTGNDSMRYWELKSRYEAEISRLTEENQRITTELAAIARLNSRKEEN